MSFKFKWHQIAFDHEADMKLFKKLSSYWNGIVNFLRKVFRWYWIILFMPNALPYANNRLPINLATLAWIEIFSWHWWLFTGEPLKLFNCCCCNFSLLPLLVFALLSYFFFCAFSAALVTFPLLASLKLTDLMTPTATVCRMSRTAKRPSGGNSWNDSTHSGLVGTRMMIAASPDLMALGFSSVVLPERRSHFSLISENLHAMCAVWQSRTGV